MWFQCPHLHVRLRTLSSFNSDHGSRPGGLGFPLHVPSHPRNHCQQCGPTNTLQAEEREGDSPPHVNPSGRELNELGRTKGKTGVGVGVGVNQKTTVLQAEAALACSRAGGMNTDLKSI